MAVGVDCIDQIKNMKRRERTGNMKSVLERLNQNFLKYLGTLRGGMKYMKEEVVGERKRTRGEGGYGNVDQAL